MSPESRIHGGEYSHAVKPVNLTVKLSYKLRRRRRRRCWLNCGDASKAKRFRPRSRERQQPICTTGQIHKTDREVSQENIILLLALVREERKVVKGEGREGHLDQLDALTV